MHICVLALSIVASMATDAAAVRATMDRYVAAWLAGDENAVMNLLTADVVLVPVEKAPYKGKDALRKYWFSPGAPKTVLTTFTSTADDIAVSGDIAVVRGTQAIAWTSAGERWRTHGNFMAVLRRTADGWKIASQMAGNTPAERVP